ncbi:MAG: TauD/TfdA family dioxygenase [Betaproteobacteria bacterium]
MKRDDAAAATLDHVVEGKKAWVRADLAEEDWLFRLPAECLAEVREAAEKLRAHPTPPEQLDASQFRLAACTRLMARVAHALDEGARFAIVDRLPLDEFSEDMGKGIYWLLSSMIARPVEQKLTGVRTYDVRDTGMKAAAGSGVRPDQTNMEQYFHNDNSYNTTPPEYVGLLCVRPARSGGISHVINFYTVHNELLRTRPEVLPRLYRPFWFDRQKEYLPGEPQVIREPMFAYSEGRLRARLGLFQIQSGYTLMNEPVDDEAVAAIAALKEVFAKRALTFDFTLERGQMQFANNRELCHRRTGFEDFDDPAGKRLLVRVWLRNSGAQRYQG